jgi:hypothetical protein
VRYLDFWLPPQDAGAPVGCLATSFTFDADFFSADCLTRFLSLTSWDPDPSNRVDIAAGIEAQERLAETRVCVLVDRSYRPQPRDLRWDVLPVSVPGGLLHAKVAVLLWENVTRVIIGSANLTSAGYRSQVEVGVAFDLDETCVVPRGVFDSLTAELRGYLDLTPGDAARGPRPRAATLMDDIEARVASAPLPTTLPRDVMVALAPTGRAPNGRVAKPLDELAAVWRGSPPQSVAALSPYWDDTEDMAGARAVLGKLARRAPTGARTEARFVVPVVGVAGTRIVRAPGRLNSIADPRFDARVVTFDAPDGRRLHAKCVQYRSSTWMATMIGSSNVTAKGLGEDPRPHRELNLWIGCRPDSPQGKALAKLVPQGEVLDAELENWEVLDDDEDETLLPALPEGFVEALLESPTTLRLTLRRDRLPSEWEVRHLGPDSRSTVLLDGSAWTRQGQPEQVVVTLPRGQGARCSVLDVAWEKGGVEVQAPWLVNVASATALPVPPEFANLPAATLLAILASNRPLAEAVADAMNGQVSRVSAERDELDPLKRYDSSGLLLHRIRLSSAALAGLERRLDQPVLSMEALEWRLAGVLGPETVADRIAEEAEVATALPGETAFLLAELALTVVRIDFDSLAPEGLTEQVRQRVDAALKHIAAKLAPVRDDVADSLLRAYVDDVVEKVAQ